MARQGRTKDIYKGTFVSKQSLIINLNKIELLLIVHNVLMGHIELISNHYRIREYPETKKKVGKLH